MKRFLLVATVVKLHVNVFHIPVLKLMKEKGFEVHVCARNDYENPEEVHIPYCDEFYNLPFERSPFKKDNLTTLMNLKHLIEINDYDIIHCHTPVGGALTRLAAKNARKRGTKVVYTAHGFHFYKGAPFKNWFTFYPIEKYLARYTDALITINKEDYIRAKSFKAINKYYVPGVGIDLNKYQKTLYNPHKKRKELGINKNTFIIISVGELNENKNHKLVLHALSKFKNENFQYLICGKGPLKNSLETLVVKLGLKGKVYFLGFRKDINEILQTADLFVFPSKREGLSLSLMEAMAAGLPAIVSDIRGNHELIDNNRGGYTVQIDNENVLADKIQLLINDKDKLTEFGKYNLNKIKDYSVNIVIKQMNDVYEMILNT